VETSAAWSHSAGAAAATWVAGLYLSKATDALDDRLGLGEALGGMILLAVAGSLPELAITISAIAQGNLDIAAGNLIGGIAMQTLVLVICDRVVKGDHPLSYLVGSLNPLLEGLLVIIVTAVMLMGTLLPESTAIGPFSPASIGIVVAWVVGIFILNRIRSAEPWQVAMPGSRPGRRHRREKHPVQPKPFVGSSTLKVVSDLRRRKRRHPHRRRDARDERQRPCRHGGHQRRGLRRHVPRRGVGAA
jgi:cation:H+ antiporter